jgi:hypothetical protein
MLLFDAILSVRFEEGRERRFGSEKWGRRKGILST